MSLFEIACSRPFFHVPGARRESQRTPLILYGLDRGAPSRPGLKTLQPATLLPMLEDIRRARSCRFPR